VAPPYFSQNIQMNEREYPRTYLNICFYSEISTINTKLTHLLILVSYPQLWPDNNWFWSQ